jgi:hypothetical protein
MPFGESGIGRSRQTLRVTLHQLIRPTIHLNDGQEPDDSRGCSFQSVGRSTCFLERNNEEEQAASLRGKKRDFEEEEI